MEKEINHSVFGTLYYNYGWVKKIELEMFGENINIQVIIDAEEDAEFEDAQVEAYKKFFEDINVKVREAEEATFNYYQEVIPQYREQFSDVEKNKNAPLISEVPELNKLVTPKQILFPMVFDEDEREAGFICDCTWEIEHGLGIKFENEKLVEVGFQDILL